MADPYENGVAVSINWGSLNGFRAPLYLQAQVSL